METQNQPATTTSAPDTPAQKGEKFGQKILDSHSKIRREFFESPDFTPDEKRAVQNKEVQITALEDTNLDAAQNILKCANRVQKMTGTDHYQAAVDLALWMAQVQFLERSGDIKKEKDAARTDIQASVLNVFKKNALRRPG